jgi:hypothetical protein
MTNHYPAQQHEPSQLLVFGIAVYALLWIAIYNGYPTVYDDTGEYLFNSFSLAQSPYRSIIYSLFIRLSSWGMTPWLIVVAQCAITIHVLRAAFEYMVHNSVMERERFVFLGLLTFLALATTLPWFVGQVMPDVFTGLSFLSAFLLLYDSQLSPDRSVLLSIVLAVSVGSHLSHLLSVGLVLSAVFVLRAFDSTRQIWPARSANGIVAFVLVPILASAGVVILSNWRAGYGLRLSAGTSVFLLDRLIESGLAGDYLEQQCKFERLTPCAYLGGLPRTLEGPTGQGSQGTIRRLNPGEFLWGSYPLLTEMGGWQGAQGEASRIASGTIRRYPIQFLAECGKQTLRQFVSVGVDNQPFQSGYTVDVLERIYPGDVPKYRLTKQWSGRLSGVARKLDSLYTVVFWTSLFTSLVLAINSHSRSEPANRLLFLTLMFLLANALVTGSLSVVYNRYQGRVSWLMGLSCAAYLVPPLLNGRNGRKLSHSQIDGPAIH